MPKCMVGEPMKTSYKAMMAALAVAVAMPMMPSGSASLFQNADHEQTCLDGNSAAVTTISAGSNYLLCLHAGVDWVLGGTIVGSDSLLSQPLGVTPVVFSLSAVMLANCHAGARTTTVGLDNGQCVDMQNGNTNANWAYFAAPTAATEGSTAGATCIADDGTATAATPASFTVSGAYYSVIGAGFGFRPMDYVVTQANGEPYFESRFLEFALPSAVENLIEDVTVSGSCGALTAATGVTVTTSLAVVTGTVGTIPGPGGLIDAVTYRAVVL